MSQDVWTAVDHYFNTMLITNDSILDAALAASEAAGLPAINVSPTQGKLLQLLAKLQGARTILEIGTLGGYSTLWLARALPAEWHLITLEADATHAEVARANVARAGLADRIELRLGNALDTLPQLAAEGAAPFDMIFIDADKRSNPAYFDWALELSRLGTLIIVDNVVRGGQVVEAASEDASVQGVRRLFERIKAEPRVSATALQSVGEKGYDGFAIMLVSG